MKCILAHWDTTTWNIPESNNTVPDILDEVKWNLDWMITMQDPDDGGVCNKTFEASFSSSFMPVRLLHLGMCGKGTAATLDFAAVMAMAYVYINHIIRLCRFMFSRCRYAAMGGSKSNKPFTNPAASGIYPAVTTGGYGDNIWR